MTSETTTSKAVEVIGTVFNIQRFSTEDGPGIRSTVFVKGCPLKCVWCHNPEGLVIKPQLMWFDVRCIGARDCLRVCPNNVLELTPEGMIIDREKCDACGLCQESCPAGALEVVGRRLTPEEAFEEVLRDEVFYKKSGGGITISGGEPTMQPRFVLELMKLCRAAGTHLAIDTSGCTSPDVFEELIDLADMVLFDLKLMDPLKHRELTGVDLEPILKNAKMVSSSGKPLWIRTPIIPGCTDSRENMRALASFIREELPTTERFDLLAFNNTCGAKYRRLGMKWELEGVPLLEKDKMEELADIARESGVLKTTWSGATRRPEV